jgi:DNA-binding XRE family transcriptional regulator
MTTLLLPELARELVRSNRVVAEALQAEVRQLKELRSEMEQAEAVKKRAIQSARDATSATVSRKAQVVGIWQQTLARFEDGLSAERWQEMLQDTQAILESWLRLAQNSRDLWEFAVTLGNRPEGLQELSSAEIDIQQVRAAVEKTHVFLTRTRPPVDIALLERGRKEIAQGRYKTADQIRSGSGQSEKE